MGILLKKLTEYSESDFYPYHMPGHKRNPVGELPEEWTQFDITEIDGFDNLHQPEEILKELQEKAAEAYGADESFYLVNGSTGGILSAVSAAVPFGGELLIARNCHKSVYHAAYLRQLTLRYIYPQILEEYDICEAVTVEQVREALEKYPQAGAVLIVSPTYEGRIADVAEIAKVVHEKGLPLIVDEAHGAHLGFGEDFAKNSCQLGADVVIHSLHKTLPSMTQTALLHCNGERVNREILKRFLHIYQTSSPSYVLMASMEEAIRIATEQKEAFACFMQQWKRMLKRLEACENINILPKSFEECAEKKHDIGKLVLSVKGMGLSGRKFYDILLEQYHLQPEMACESYVLAMFAVGDTEEGFERLTQAVLDLDRKLAKDSAVKEQKMRETGVTVHACEAFSICKAWDAEKERVELTQAIGRVAGDFINLYPPGTPIIVPGEQLSSEIIQLLHNCLEAGLSVQGIDAETKVCVLKKSESGQKTDSYI